MARRRDFVRGAVAIGKRRETTWFQFLPAEVTVASGANLIFSLNAAALALRPFTIVRSHFMISLKSDQSAAIERQEGAVGLAVVSDQAVAVGITAVPTPITEMGSNLWLLHQLIYADESSLTDRTRPQMNIEVDSKAMRKVEVGSDLIVVVEITSASNGAIFIVGGRMLVKNN